MGYEGDINLPRRMCEEGGDSGCLVEVDQFGGESFVDLANFAEGPVDGAGADTELLDGVLHGADL